MKTEIEHAGHTLNSKHTPGPWNISAESNGSFIYGNTRPDLNRPALAMVYPAFEGQANAKLIASAPALLRQRDELLKALQDMLDYTTTKIDSHRLRELGQIESQARTALANCEKENRP